MRLALGPPMRRLALSMFIVLSLVRCGGGSSPTEPSSPGAPSTTLLQGQTLNAIDGAVVPNLSVRIGTRFPITSDSSGFFQTDLSNQSPTTVVVSGGSVVERETRMGPSASRTRVAMIPSSFDLGAFDEMFRSSNAQLQRWTSRPSLVILGAVMDYRNGSDQTYSATGDQLTDAEVEQLKAHLTEGLALLTGNTYTTFASIEIERPSGGARVNTLRAGQIVVGRYNGIVSLAKDDRLRPLVGTARRQHRRRGHVSRSRFRSRRQPAPAAADSRAWPRTRLPARRVANVDHESLGRTGADRVRSRRRDHRFRAPGRQQEPGHRSCIDGLVGIDRRGPMGGAHNRVRLTDSARAELAERLIRVGSSAGVAVRSRHSCLASVISCSSFCARRDRTVGSIDRSYQALG